MIPMLPERLLKEKKQKKNSVNHEQHVIAIQVIVLIVFIVGMACAFGWVELRNHQATVRALDALKKPTVAVTMPIKVVGDKNRILGVTDTVSTSTVTVYGKVNDYVTLNSTYSGLDVRVDQTSVTPNALSGEFAQTISLNEGVNTIPITVAWEGADRFRYSYTITYTPPIDGRAATGTLTP
jgi:hypothetical protein